MVLFDLRSASLLQRERADKRLSDHAFLAELKTIYKVIRQFERIDPALDSVGDALRKLLGARVLIVYLCVENDRKLNATYCGVDLEDSIGDESHVLRTATSLADHVALTQRAVLLPDTNDTEELCSIHPELRFDGQLCATQGWPVSSAIALPIKGVMLLGVLQLFRFDEDAPFDGIDLKRAALISQMLAREFNDEQQKETGPFGRLVEEGSLSKQDLMEAKAYARQHGASTAKVLMDNYGLSVARIGQLLERYYRVPFVVYDPKLTLPSSLLSNISRSYLRKNLWLPIGRHKSTVVILIDDPLDHQRVREIHSVLNVQHCTLKVGLPEHILLFLSDDSTTDADTGFEDLFSVLASQRRAVQPESEAEDDYGAEASGMIQLINRIIAEADRLGASDIHIEPSREGESGTVRIRVDGLCRRLLEIPEEHCSAAIARVKVISRLNIAERRLPQDGKCKLKLAGRTVEMRVATLPTVYGESVVMRLLTPGTPMQLENLSLSLANQRAIMKIATQPHGLFLVVGPTGSGKTTTLHAVLSKLNVPERKIWTAEDPVEITQDGLQQVQVQSNINFTFAMAMRAFLRADPDVILIGEMRDRETANIGIEASLTGHLVLSTLHTNSAAETITRLLDLGLDPINFSDALLGVLAQRLIRTLCSKCKQPYEPDEEEKQRLRHFYGEKAFVEQGLDVKEWKLCRAVGCTECGSTGYKGRLAIHEMLICGSRLRNLINRRAGLDELRDQAVKEGMRTMRQDGIEKIVSGYSDYSQLIQVVGVGLG